MAVSVSPASHSIISLFLRTLRTEIISYLKDKCSISIDPFYIDPDYFFVEVVSKVYYNKELTNKVSGDIQYVTKQAIQNYNSLYLYNFSSDLHFSKLTAAIDNADASIISNETDVRIIKRITPTKGQVYKLSFSLAAALNQTSTLPAIRSSFFTYEDEKGVSYNAIMEDDGNGVLYIYYTNTNGLRITLVTNVGTVDYTSGKISISNLMTADYSGWVNIYCRMATRDFYTSRNQMLAIDTLDVTVDVFKVS
jgi:hypothetical protein